MRNPLVLSVLAALLLASAAFAAKPLSGTAELNDLNASGITGTASIKVDADGNARVHMQLDGLTPGGVYDLVLYFSGPTCGSGTRVEITEFTANPAGKANFNVVVGPQAAPPIVGITSITVEQGAQLSCGEISLQ